ncbi:MAG: hypothetical protein PVJ39_04460 [Gammaproteobacteria bacterium]
MISGKDYFITRILQITALLVLLAPAQLFGAAQTDTEIRNYSSKDLTIEYKEVNLKGGVTWVPIGTISKRNSRMFRNITIGSVLRAKHNNQVIEKFIVRSPPSNSSHTIIDIRD